MISLELHFEARREGLCHEYTTWLDDEQIIGSLISREKLKVCV